jgi:hypothetical protein
MITLNVHFHDMPIIHLGALLKELVQPPREWAYEDSLAVLRYPYQVILQAVGRMCINAIFAHTTKHAAGNSNE